MSAMTNDIPTFNHNDCEIVNRALLYNGFLKIAEYKLRFRLFGGGVSEIITRQVLEREVAVAVLPYDPNQDAIILIEQFRIGALKESVSPWLLEIVAGLIEPEETPTHVAIREAKEEAGCDILELHPIYNYFISPGGSNEYLHLFCGRFNATQTEGIFGLPDEHEDIRMRLMRVDEAFALLEKGNIKTAPAIVALLWLKLNKSWLKQLWQTI